ncbi:MAG: hypothetical protein ACW98Y_18330, partial [Candidatus Thorarchaeota archaeon]
MDQKVVPLLFTIITVSAALSILIATPRIAIVSSILIGYILLLFILEIFSDEKLNLKVSFSTLVQKPIIPLLVALAASAIILIPTDYHFGAIEFIEYASYLNIVDWLKVISTAFMLSIFPGWIAFYTFGRSKTHSHYESIVFVLLVSYIVSSVATAIVRNLIHTLDALSILVTIWLAIGIIFSFRQQTNISNNHNETSVSWGFFIPLLTAILVMMLAYIIVLSSIPTHSVLRGDIARYVAGSSAFVRGEQVTLPYIMISVQIASFSTLSNLCPFYSYMMLQYYSILFPIAFYIFGYEIS